MGYLLLYNRFIILEEIEEGVKKNLQVGVEMCLFEVVYLFEVVDFLNDILNLDLLVQV